jgi:hypothetical protein
MAFKAGKPRSHASRAHCENIPRPRIHISRAGRADFVIPAPGRFFGLSGFRFH